MKTLVALLLLFSALSSAWGQGIEELQKKYAITVVTEAPPFPVKATYGRIEGKPAEKKDLDSYLKILLEEWNLYPPELVTKTGLKRIILCQELAFNGQRRTAIPDFEHDDLYFDVSRGRSNALYVRKVIHHEYFHVIDLRDDGQLYRDPAWAALNPEGFQYGAGGAAVQNDSSVSLPSDSIPGFLNKYGATGVEEDKAELFAALFAEPERVAKRVEQDSFLAAKLARLKELLQAFVPTMDKTFWERFPRKTEEKPGGGANTEGL